MSQQRRSWAPRASVARALAVAVAWTVTAAQGATVPPAQRPLPPDAMTAIGGFWAGRCDRSADNLLLRFDIERYVRLFEEPKSRDWASVGEQAGKWLEPAAMSGNGELRTKAAEVLRRLVAAQGEDGYLGITDPKLRSESRPIRAMEAYELYATLQALLTVHERWGEASSLTAAKRLGDYLVEHIGPGKAEFWPVPNDVTIAGRSDRYGLEGTLLAGPMARLHRVSGDAKYLKWSEWVIASIDRWSGASTLSNLDKVASGRLDIHQIQPVVHAHALHLNLLGLLELYRATGDAGLLRKVRAAWRDIKSSRVYIAGGVGAAERYHGGHHLPNTGDVAETCAAASWLLLSQRLLESTGEAAFADAVERLLWNHLPAAQTVDGDGWRRFTPLAGWKPDGCFTGPDCCSAAGPLVVAELPTLLLATTPDGIAVNQYVPCAARIALPSGNRVAVQIETHYPVGEKVTLVVRPAEAERFALRLRLPGWCGEPTLSVNGKPIDEPWEPPAYAVITRTWRPGDKVELALPMAARWVAGRHGNDGLHALVRGPVVFALDSVWASDATRRTLAGDAKGDPLPGLAGVVLDRGRPEWGIRPAPTPEQALGPAFDIRIAFADGRRARATMLPFANIGIWHRSEAERRERKGRRDTYAVWLPEATSGRFRPVDLRAAVNVHPSPSRGLFTSPAAREEIFRFPRYGRYAVNGVPFEVIDPATNRGRGLLILRGGPGGALAQRYPTRAVVPVGFRCRAIHILGAVAGWGFPANQDRKPAVTVRIRYEDARTQDVSLVNGEHLADFNGPHDVPHSRPALALGPHQLRTLRIPTHPHSPVTRIELLDTHSPLAPLFAALTAELPH